MFEMLQKKMNQYKHVLRCSCRHVKVIVSTPHAQPQLETRRSPRGDSIGRFGSEAASPLPPLVVKFELISPVSQGEMSVIDKPDQQ